MMAGSALTDDSALEYTFQLLLQLLMGDLRPICPKVLFTLLCRVVFLPARRR